MVAIDAANGAELERIAPGAGGFIRVTMRSFAMERKQRGMGADVPFQLTRMRDGDLVLTRSADRPHHASQRLRPSQ